MKKVITVLQALEIGIPVKIKSIKEDIFLSEDNDICIKRSERVLRLNFGMLSFREFVGMCNKISNDEILKINANIALNKITGTRG